MPYNVTASFSNSQVRLSGERAIELYVLNSSLTGFEPMYYINNNQDVYSFNMTASGNLGATEQLYTGFPIERGLIKNSLDGTISEISVSIPNTNRVMEAVIQNNNYLRGNEVYIMTGFGKSLPTGNTANHIGISPDRFSIMKEKMFVDGVASDENAVTFLCKPKFSLRNVVLPGRTYSRECFWAMRKTYRGTECLGNRHINATLYPKCDGTLEQCRERGNTARYGGFPGIPGKGFSIIS